MDQTFSVIRVKYASQDSLYVMELLHVWMGQMNIIALKVSEQTLFMPWPSRIKGTQMGLLLALVCLCFRKNVIVTCKIVSFFV